MAGVSAGFLSIRETYFIHYVIISYIIHDEVEIISTETHSVP